MGQVYLHFLGLCPLRLPLLSPEASLWALRVGRESRGSREGESQHPPSPSGPAQRPTGQAARTALQAKAYDFIIYLNPPAAHSGNPAAAPPPLDRGSKLLTAPPGFRQRFGVLAPALWARPLTGALNHRLLLLAAAGGFTTTAKNRACLPNRSGFLASRFAFYFFRTQHS